MTPGDRLHKAEKLALASAPVLAVVVSVFALYFGTNAQNASTQSAKESSEASARIERSQNALRAALEADQRFSALVKQAGSNQPLERIAGIYGLRDLANGKNGDLTVRITQVFAAYLRDSAKHVAVRTNGQLEVFAQNLAAITKAVNTRPSIRDRVRLNLRGAQLRDVPMVGLRARYGYFANASFARSDLRNAGLSCVNLDHADFAGTRLDHARIHFVYVRGTNLAKSQFGRANITRAYWDGERPDLPRIKGVAVPRSGGLAAYCKRCKCG